MALHRDSAVVVRLRDATDRLNATEEKFCRELPGADAAKATALANELAPVRREWNAAFDAFEEAQHA